MSGGTPADDSPLTGAPDVAGYSVGWRAWSVSSRGTVLRSPTGSEIWPAGGPMVAKCRIYREHCAPVPGCMCGLYGVTDAVSAYLTGQRAVLGCVALWGTLVEGERGWRASHAYPLLLLTSPRVSAAARDRLAAAYRVPVYAFPVQRAVYALTGEVRQRMDALRERAATPGASFDDLIEELRSMLERKPTNPAAPAPKTVGTQAKPSPRRGITLAPWPRSVTGDGTLAGYVAAVIVVVAAALALFAFANTIGEPVYSAKIADNAPPGSCLPGQQNWAYHTVTADSCNRPHWGEVLGYPALAPVPSPYPGDAVVDARARFACGRLLAERGWSPSEYGSTSISADPASWNTGGKNYQNYATCVVYRRDNAPIPPGHPHGPPRTAVTVPMSLFDTSLSTNAPVGTCVATHPGVSAGSGKVPVVDCKQPHWAKVLGYPTLYRPGSRWPGDDAVYDAAQAACRRFSLPPGQVSDLIWPAKNWWDNPKQSMYASCLAVPRH